MEFTIRAVGANPVRFSACVKYRRYSVFAKCGVVEIPQDGFAVSRLHSKRMMGVPPKLGLRLVARAASLAADIGWLGSRCYCYPLLPCWIRPEQSKTDDRGDDSRRCCGKQPQPASIRYDRSLLRLRS